MAGNINMLDAMRDYARGGWVWGHRDCIGLMIMLLRKCTGKHIRLVDYMPQGMTYEQAVDWLVTQNEFALFPYLHLLDQDMQLHRSGPDEDGHLIIMYKGPPVHTSSGEQYPIDPVPGIAFKPPGKIPLVMGRRGLVNATILENQIEHLIRYRLPNVI